MTKLEKKLINKTSKTINNIEKKVEKEIINIYNEMKNGIMLRIPTNIIGIEFNNSLKKALQTFINKKYEEIDEAIKVNVSSSYKSKYFLNMWSTSMQAQYSFPVILPIRTAKTILKRSWDSKIVSKSKKISNIIFKNLLRGNSHKDMAKIIDILLGFRDKKGKIIKIGKKSNIYKSIRIARTELGRYNSIADLEAFNYTKKIGIVSYLVWISTLDMRTRDTHRHLDGKESNKKGQFNYAGGWYYQKQTGIAAQDINCRCSTYQKVSNLTPKFRRVGTKIEKYQIYETWLQNQ